MKINAFTYSLLIALLLNVPGLAQTQEEFQAALPGFEIFSLNSAEGWCLMGVSQTERGMDGAALARHQPQGWEVVYLCGGILSGRDLYHFGVPIETIGRLGFRLKEQDLEAIRTSTPPWPDGTQVPFTADMVRTYSDWELNLMVNEILARHGRKFSDPFLREYFQARPWYKVNLTYSDNQLGRTAAQNVALLRRTLISRGPRRPFR